MIRHRADIDDERLFDRDEAEQCRRERAAVIETARLRAEQLEAQEAIERAAVRESMKQASAQFILEEYIHAGVEPPSVDSDGNPTCSMSMLFRLGWRLEEIPRLGIKTWVKPPPPQKYEPKGECS